tara:strand:+ start:191 stop:454 length:264 start_codon:yes stop_codon:yes gene_type:complete
MRSYKTINNKLDILKYYIKKLILKLFTKNLDKSFSPGWKKIVADDLMIKHQNMKYRIIESRDSKLISKIDIKEEENLEISEDIYPMN